VESIPQRKNDKKLNQIRPSDHSESSLQKKTPTELYFVILKTISIDNPPIPTTTHNKENGYKSPKDEKEEQEKEKEKDLEKEDQNLKQKSTENIEINEPTDEEKDEKVINS